MSESRVSLSCHRIFLCMLLLLMGGLLSIAQTTRPFLYTLFTDDMIMQRGMADPVWGWTDPGKVVTVSMAGKTATATADAQGKWMAKIGPFQVGGPYTMTVSGPQTVTLNNVMVGDVWICSGQSNMEMGIGVAGNAQQEIANANYPNIRLFTVPKSIKLDPQDSIKASWQICTPQSIAAGGWGGFSAAGYYFGRFLHQQLNIPIGLIHTSWGGTPAEAWTSVEALRTMPDFQTTLNNMAKFNAGIKDGTLHFDDELANWWQQNDPGSANGLGWADPVFDAADWKTMNLPKNWEQAGLPGFDGAVWFRKDIDLPATAAGKAAILHMGVITDQDTTWVNGVKVGATLLRNPQRNYRIPANVLKEGRNVIAVRVFNQGGNGGFTGAPEQMSLEIPGNAPISLANVWQYKDTVVKSKAPGIPVRYDNSPYLPVVLYNGMIAPLVPFAFKGAIWYQGEANVGRAKQYASLLPTMIQDWRTRFNVGNFPFLIVQLANFQPSPAQPAESAWAELQEAQSIIAEKVPNTGLAVAVDIGEVKDIHPKNKQEVGRRLGLTALGIAYGQQIEYSGPDYKSMTIEGNAIRLTFNHLGGGLVTKDNEKLVGFAIAGADKKFVWADAVIDGDTIVVSSPEVTAPVAVRYAWGNSPPCNLYNKAGLPAIPFRTDSPKY